MYHGKTNKINWILIESGGGLTVKDSIQTELTSLTPQFKAI